MGTMYDVTYREPDGLSEEAHNSVAALPGKATLTEAVANCRDFGVSADLYSANGERRGWVHSDGTYRLS